VGQAGDRTRGSAVYGAVRVDGYLEEEIVHGEVLIIGERGRVNGEITVGALRVSGHVRVRT
jgi:cytoskeletal protein CcmA (bactofilin family)